MSTDFYLVRNQDLIRLGYRGGHPDSFVWYVFYPHYKDVEPFEVWDDYANTYTREEFEQMLAQTEQVLPIKPNLGENKSFFLNGIHAEYWSHKSPDGKYRERYKRLVMGIDKL